MILNDALDDFPALIGDRYGLGTAYGNDFLLTYGNDSHLWSMMTSWAAALACEQARSA
jgi:hypothetical protein